MPLRCSVIEVYHCIKLQHSSKAEAPQICTGQVTKDAAI